MNNINLITILLTGLLTGGFTCMAVQGGLLAATIAQREEERLKEHTKTSGHVLPILSFLTAKILAYTILGALLGLFGSFFKLSVSTQVILQVTVVIFMVGTAFNILNIHPIFRYFIIQPPRFLTRFIRKESKSNHIFAPALLGLFTIFIPCGTTQAMMALSIGSGKPLLGAAILFAFVLGTSPVFFILGYFSTKLGGLFQQRFMRFAAIAIILLAVFNLNNAISLTGSNFTLDNAWNAIWCTVSFCNLPIANTQITQNASIIITNRGYTPVPQSITVRASSPVTLRLKNESGAGCTQAFTIPALNIQKVVPLGVSDTITFKAPANPGPLTFMCSMGMYKGIINVI